MAVYHHPLQLNSNLKRATQSSKVVGKQFLSTSKFFHFPIRISCSSVLLQVLIDHLSLTISNLRYGI